MSRIFSLIIVVTCGLYMTGCQESNKPQVRSSATSEPLVEYPINEQEPAYVVVQVKANNRTVVDDMTLFTIAKGLKYILKLTEENKQISNLRSENQSGPQAFLVIREYNNFEEARSEVKVITEQLSTPPDVSLPAIFAIPRSLYVSIAQNRDFEPYIRFYNNRLEK